MTYTPFYEMHPYWTVWFRVIGKVRVDSAQVRVTSLSYPLWGTPCRLRVRNIPCRLGGPTCRLPIEQ